VKSSATKLGLVIISLAAAAGTATFARTVQPSYAGSKFSEVWGALNKNLYERLPVYSIVSALKLQSVATFAMNATLDNRNDFRPSRIKLVHPNGICLAGMWEINQDSPYSGYFAKNRKALVVARASATQDIVDFNEYRAFGLAVKIFPTLDESQTVFTSNLFSVDNVPGVLHQRYADTLMTNQIPDFDVLSKDRSSAVRLAKKLPFLMTFNYLSKKNDSGPENRNPLMRRTVEVARAGISQEYSAVDESSHLPSFRQLNSEKKIIEPTWVGFEVDDTTIKSNARDFRNEVAELVTQNKELKYKILVASSKNASGTQNWSRIGTMTFTKAVASEPCDKELHFHHPRTDE
jgi:hypothetical protein